MERNISQEQTENIIRKSTNALAVKLLDAVHQHPGPFTLSGPTPKKDLFNIYSVRMERYLKGAGPECEGMQDFVAALDSPGSVEMLSVETSEQTLLATIENDSLVGILGVGKVNRTP